MPFEVFVAGNGIKDDREKTRLFLYRPGIVVQDISETLSETCTYNKTALERLGKHLTPKSEHSVTPWFISTNLPKGR